MIYSLHIIQNGEVIMTSTPMGGEDLAALLNDLKLTGDYEIKIWDIGTGRYTEDII